ncbi:MAG: hypothetical protein ACRCUY_10040 [Thermoguttaceae bacterium]
MRALDERTLKLFLGDCRKVQPSLPNDSVDLIFTSPLCANKRKNNVRQKIARRLQREL